jgi:hypothetical protein
VFAAHVSIHTFDDGDYCRRIFPVIIELIPCRWLPSADPASSQGYSAGLGIQRTPTRSLARAFTFW